MKTQQPETKNTETKKFATGAAPTTWQLGRDADRRRVNRRKDDQGGHEERGGTATLTKPLASDEDAGETKRIYI